jgi:hypothetical protein
MELNPNLCNGVCNLLIQRSSVWSLSSVCSAALAHIARQRPRRVRSERANTVYHAA